MLHQGHAVLFGQKDQDYQAKHSEQAQGINILVGLPDSMWTAGLLVWSKGQDHNLD